MPGILSQEEINALIAAIATEEEQEAREAPESGVVSAGDEAEGRRVLPYDFSRPHKLSKEQLRTLQAMHEAFARGLASGLSAYLRALVEAQVVSAEAMPYDDFARGVANPGIMAVFKLPPLEGSIIVELAPALGLAMLDRLLGGPGTRPRRVRELTELEQPVIKRIIERAMESFPAAWDHVIPVKPQFEHLELNPRYAQLVPPGELVIVISLEVSLRGVPGRLNLCIPYVVIEPVVEKLSAHYLFSDVRRGATPLQDRALRQRIGSVAVPVRVLLGRAEVTIQELLELQEGDYIPVDTRVDEPLTVLVGSRPKFLARPGRSGGRMAFAVVDTIDPEEEEMSS